MQVQTFANDGREEGATFCQHFGIGRLCFIDVMAIMLITCVLVALGQIDWFSAITLYLFGAGRDAT